MSPVPRHDCPAGVPEAESQIYEAHVRDVEPTLLQIGSEMMIDEAPLTVDGDARNNPRTPYRVDSVEGRQRRMEVYYVEGLKLNELADVTGSHRQGLGADDLVEALRIARSLRT